LPNNKQKKMRMIFCILMHWLNSRKVKSQMSKEDVLSIMEKPDNIIIERFCYTTNDDSYPYIEFSLDSLKRVKEIYSPEK